MGTSYKASLGYGINIIDQVLADEIANEIREQDEAFRVIWSGDAYSNEVDTLLVIKESVQSVYSWTEQKDPINANELIVKPDWDNKIKKWCIENNITEPKIGWWLCSSIS